MVNGCVFNDTLDLHDSFLVLTELRQEIYRHHGGLDVLGNVDYFFKPRNT